MSTRFDISIFSGATDSINWASSIYNSFLYYDSDPVVIKICARVMPISDNIYLKKSA